MHDFLVLPTSLTNKYQNRGAVLPPLFSTSQYQLFSQGKDIETVNGTCIYINGYVLPKNECFTLYKNLKQHNLIAELYLRYGKEFIRYVKGIFIIILFENDNIQIFTDQLGIFRIFYYIDKGELIISNSVSHIKKTGINTSLDETSLWMQSLFNRVPSKYTIYKNIFKNIYGTAISLSDRQANISSYWNPEELLTKLKDSKTTEYDVLAYGFRECVSNFNEYLKPKDNFITLTGGKDSRTILTALLNLGIISKGFTYGNNKSRDAEYAHLVAEAAEIEHFINNPIVNKEWITERAKEIAEIGNPEINIHRSHRLDAFSQMRKISDKKTAFYTGYMGGEFLMGVYYDNLIFTDFLTRAWGKSEINGIVPRLNSYFHKISSSTIMMVDERIGEIRSMHNQVSKENQAFYSLFEIGIPHYSQDICLSHGMWNFPYPVFLDIDFLEMLFSSKFSLLNNNNATINPFKRHKLYALNLSIQHLLYPGLDEVPFGKKGSYNTTEYLRGSFYWSMLKIFRYFTKKQHFPSSFVYGSAYQEFLLENLSCIQADHSNILNELFAIPSATKSLSSADSLTYERNMHPYSNIVMYNLFDKALNNED